MNRYVLLTAAAMMALATSAQASTPGYYFSGLAGASLLPSLGYKDSSGLHAATGFDTGYTFGGAVGYDTGDGWRYELDSLYQLANVDQFDGATATGHIWSTGIMANTTYDLTANTQFTPYIGAGLGVQDVGGSINGFSGDSWRPAYQLEAGLRDDISPTLSAFAEYRFTQSEATKLQNLPDYADQHFSDHALMVGLTYHLGD